MQGCQFTRKVPIHEEGARSEEANIRRCTEEDSKFRRGQFTRRVSIPEEAIHEETILEGGARSDRCCDSEESIMRVTYYEDSTQRKGIDDGLDSKKGLEKGLIMTMSFRETIPAALQTKANLHQEAP